MNAKLSNEDILSSGIFINLFFIKNAEYFHSIKVAHFTLKKVFYSRSMKIQAKFKMSGMSSDYRTCNNSFIVRWCAREASCGSWKISIINKLLDEVEFYSVNNFPFIYILLV